MLIHKFSDLVLLKLHRNNKRIYIAQVEIFSFQLTIASPSLSYKKSKDESDEKFNFKKIDVAKVPVKSLSNAPGKKLSVVLGVEAGRRRERTSRGLRGPWQGCSEEGTQTRLEGAVHKLTTPPHSHQHCNGREHSRKEEHTRKCHAQLLYIYSEESREKDACRSQGSSVGFRAEPESTLAENRCFSRTVILRLLKCPEVQRTM